MENKDKYYDDLEPSTRLSGAGLSRRKSIVNGGTNSNTGIAPLCSLDDHTLQNVTNLETHDEILQIFIKQPFMQVCRVSPLFNFKYAATKLKQYALKIKQFISSNVKTNVNINYKTEFEVVEDLKLDSNHSDGIMVSVWKTNETGEVTKLFYRGVLFSWGYFAATKEPNMTHLPLLLDYGQNRYVTATRDILSKLFDCIISPMACTQSELLLFSALLSSFSPVHGAKFITYTYDIPLTKVPTTLDISIEADDVHSWWKSCYEQNDATKIYDITTTKTLYSLYQDYIKEYYAIDITKLILTNLRYPGVTLQSRGVLKINDLEAAKVVLKIFCEMSVILRGSIPKLSYDYD